MGTTRTIHQHNPQLLGFPHLDLLVGTALVEVRNARLHGSSEWTKQQEVVVFLGKSFFQEALQWATKPLILRVEVGGCQWMCHIITLISSWWWTGKISVGLHGDKLWVLDYPEWRLMAIELHEIASRTIRIKYTCIVHTSCTLILLLISDLFKSN